MGRRLRGVLATVATVVGSIAIVRLADAVGKRELERAARDVDAEQHAVVAAHDSLADVRERLSQDSAFLSYRISALSKREPYLLVNRGERKLVLAVQEKTILETRYRLGGLKAQDELKALPPATLEVLSRQAGTVWYKPDWLYRLEGVLPPADSAARAVKNAFGAGAVALGGDIVIHGKVSDIVPAEAIDHTYIELDDAPLRSIVDAVKPGTLVLIR
jgi:hypothetical protein